MLNKHFKNKSNEMVYVQDIDGNPLMPTIRHGKVRRLLKSNKAVVVSLCPFTIRLTYTTTSYKQEIVLGVDAGTKHVGLSATTKSKELYASEVTLRSDIVELLSVRRELRKTRRSRLRYRKSRFNNRVDPSKEIRLVPSIRQRINSHLKQISDIHSILPISKIIIEVAQFDTQKLKNPDIKNEEYQQGEQLGFWNTREYVLARDGHKCQHCKGKSKDPVLNVHHLESRKTGGNSPSNLITLCETCHKNYHKGKFELKIKRGEPLRDAAVMGVMKWMLYKELKCLYPDIKMTFGYITKYNRINYGIQKSHISDAFVISKNFDAARLGFSYNIRLTRRHNRQIHRMKILKGGIKKSNQCPFEIFGFRLFDKVFFNNRYYFVCSRRVRGQFKIKNFDLEDTKEISYKKLKLHRVRRNPIYRSEQMSIFC